ncbi:PREDICTED: mitochondrial cardiolipin hydrolase [Cyphomyrmex costatus]|uniref:mitochondrial cardiolipin hydrolase n=1 Tax=Cyphomyrmex costatus TaxID=456900 RepID=UPI0008521FED|nr:PREDICTED: mitochondrial cardiolipin hydrolase [Cyphomyrmex costatus]
MMKRIFVVITSGVIVSEVMWQLYKRYKHSRKKVINISNFNGCAKQLCKNAEAKIFEVMFFSQDCILCRSHLTIMKPCAKLNCSVRYLRRIIHYLDFATYTLDVCIYFFTFPELAEAIIKAKNRNVIVRIIMEESMGRNDNSQLMNFYKEGIKPISKQLDVLMHHKFVIIDNNILITGSINWTKSAFFGNFENVIVTNESAIVKPFINEFERIFTMLTATTTEADSKNLDIH